MLFFAKFNICCILFCSVAVLITDGYPMTLQVLQNSSPQSRMLDNLFKPDEKEVDNMIMNYPSFQNLPTVNPRVMSDVYPNSKIFYFRLPVSDFPYLYLNDLANFMGQNVRRNSYVPYNMAESSEPVHLPVTFTANGKPSTIYTFPQDDFQIQTSRPLLRPSVSKPTEKPIINLNKTPYTFNGKPTDIYLLQNAFNSIMSNSALSTFYP